MFLYLSISHYQSILNICLRCSSSSPDFKISVRAHILYRVYKDYDNNLYNPDMMHTHTDTHITFKEVENIKLRGPITLCAYDIKQCLKDATN